MHCRVLDTLCPSQRCKGYPSGPEELVGEEMDLDELVLTHASLGRVLIPGCTGMKEKHRLALVLVRR